MAFRIFTVAEARQFLPELQDRARELITLRADTTELADAVREGRPSTLGGQAEYKAGEARVHELLEWIVGAGLEPKSIAPLLIDFHAEIDGQLVLLCWLENEPALEWYHKPEYGFSGRRPIPPDWP
ncbi:MAG TPA: DUF2203 domain-containing protein [Jiangellaceae bacterium]|nr:DUF2203 domain-containing protein [Jiangellaceae bacterium]